MYEMEEMGLTLAQQKFNFAYSMAFKWLQKHSWENNIKSVTKLCKVSSTSGILQPVTERLHIYFYHDTHKMTIICAMWSNG